MFFLRNNMHFKKIILLCTAFCLFLKLSSEQNFETHLVMTILDNSEPSEYRNEIEQNGTLTENLGASATYLLIALLEEQSIIIVNSSVVHYLMRYLKEVSNNPLNLIPLQIIKPHHWIKKKISNYLYILIPRHYFNNLHTQKKFQQTPARFDSQELTLGIPFKMLTELRDYDFINPAFHCALHTYPSHTETEEVTLYSKTIVFTRELSWISRHFIEHLSTIFISKKEYWNCKNLAPRYIMIASGHGSPHYALAQRIKELQKYGSHATQEINYLKQLTSSGKTAYYGGSIAGLNSKDFGEFANFLTEHCNVRLLFFNTCYGSELNIQEALNAASINFPIISGALANGTAKNVIHTETSWDSYSQNTTAYIIKPVFKEFLTKLNHEKHVYSDSLLLEALHAIYHVSEKNDQSYNNIPSIKRPDTPWRVFEQPFMIVLNEELTDRQNGESLDVSCKIHTHLPTMCQNPIILLLQTSHIPYKLIISGQKYIDVPAFISYLPGDATHHFTNIDAHTISPFSFFRAFFKIPDLQEHKIFLIDEVTLKNNVPELAPCGAIITLKNVVICNEIDYDTTEELVKKSISFECCGTTWSIITKGEENPSVQHLKKIILPPQEKYTHEKTNDTDEIEDLNTYEMPFHRQSTSQNKISAILHWLYACIW